MSRESDYAKYRGKCKEMAEAACAADPTLTLVRGHYYCPMWNSEQAHWWTMRPDGTVHDPSCLQFPSGGLGTYAPFTGTLTCSECGAETREEDARCEGNYVFCSYGCYGKFVGMIT